MSCWSTTGTMGPMAPLLGGGRCSRERLAGGRVWLVEPLGVPPVVQSSPGSWPSRESWGEHHLPRVYVRILVRLHRFYRFLLVNIVDSFLPIAWCRLQSSMLSKLRPPEELLHRTRRASRGESDSSAPEVPGGLLVVVFEASRPNTGICRANN